MLLPETLFLISSGVLVANLVAIKTLSLLVNLFTAAPKILSLAPS